RHVAPDGGDVRDIRDGQGLGRRDRKVGPGAFRPAPGRDHRSPGLAAADRSPDGRLRPLRPRGPRPSVGEDGRGGERGQGCGASLGTTSGTGPTGQGAITPWPVPIPGFHRRIDTVTSRRGPATHRPAFLWTASAYEVSYQHCPGL